MRVLLSLHLVLLLLGSCTFSNELDEVSADLARGKAFYEKGEYQKALLQFKRIENLFPKNHFFPVLSGRCYRMLDETELAETFFAQSLRLKPFYHLALIELALTLEKKHRNFQAIEKLKTGIDRFQKSLAENHSIYAQEELWVLTQLVGAHKIHRQIVEFHLTSLLATLYRRVSDFKNAQGWLDKAEEFTFNDDSRTAISQEKGIIALLTNKPSDALAYFRSSCAKPPCDKNQDPFQKITGGFIVHEIDADEFELYLKGGEYATSDPVASLGYFKRACELAINFPTACMKAVDGLLLANENSLAHALLKKMIQQNYGDLNLRLKYIQFLVDGGRFSDASDIIENTEQVVTLSIDEAAKLKSLQTEVKEKKTIQKHFENYLGWVNNQNWKEIYAMQCDFLKKRVSFPMFEENANRNALPGKFDNCRLQTIELDLPRKQAQVVFECGKRTQSKNTLEKRRALRLIQENQTWKWVASENQDVFDDFMQHQQ